MLARLSYAWVVATLALFATPGGKATTTTLARDSVGTPQTKTDASARRRSRPTRYAARRSRGRGTQPGDPGRERPPRRHRAGHPHRTRGPGACRDGRPLLLSRVVASGSQSRPSDDRNGRGSSVCAGGRPRSWFALASAWRAEAVVSTEAGETTAVDVHSECVDYRPETLATTPMEKRRPREVSLVLGPLILTHSLWRDSDVFSRSQRLWPAQLDTAANSVAAGEGCA
jgi:hypothetical protein